MFRSFHLAGQVALKRELQKRSMPDAQVQQLEEWTRFWREWIIHIYFQGWRSRLEGTKLIPGSEPAIRALLTALVLENAFTEVSTALTRRTGAERAEIETVLHILERAQAQ